MDFAEKLKEMRKQEGLSQEQLSEKIGVSRQAITKWETGKGLPDIENLIILAEIFKMSIDELVAQEVKQREQVGNLNHSETIYDIDQNVEIDIRLIRANTIEVGMNDCEKLHIRIESNTIEDLSSLLKIKMIDAGKRLEVKCIKKSEISDKSMEQDLYIHILLPINYCRHCELSAEAGMLNMKELNIDRFEYDGGAKFTTISKCSGKIEFAGSSDYDIAIDKISGSLEIAQIKANSKIHFSEKSDFDLKLNKKKVKIFWEQNEVECEPFSSEDSENTLVFNGIKSELILSRQL